MCIPALLHQKALWRRSCAARQVLVDGYISPTRHSVPHNGFLIPWTSQDRASGKERTKPQGRSHYAHLLWRGIWGTFLPAPFHHSTMMWDLGTFLLAFFHHSTPVFSHYLPHHCLNLLVNFVLRIRNLQRRLRYSWRTRSPTLTDSCKTNKRQKVSRLGKMRSWDKCILVNPLETSTQSSWRVPTERHE